MANRTFFLVAGCLAILLSFPCNSRAQWISYETEIVAEELNVPWEIRWGFDNWIWFTERSGRVTKVNPLTKAKKVILHVPAADHSDAEKGTLGFDFHPDFPDSPYIYLAYNHYREEESHFNLVRWTWSPDTLTEPLVLLDHLPTGLIHNGSRVCFGPDRKLYVSTGEANQPELAQDLGSYSGKILRMNSDGSAPSDNPIPGSLVWSVGHRNPQGLTFGPTGNLYSTEHGPASDDELNLIAKGGNYGWPLVEGICNREIELQPCESLAVKEPMTWWTPTVAVTGIEYCDRSTFPEWKNSLLLATLKDESLWVLKLSDDGSHFQGSYRYPLKYSGSDAPLRRLHDFCFSPDGELYVSTSNIWSAEWNPDKIVQVKRLGSAPSIVTLSAPTSDTLLASPEVTFIWSYAFIGASYELQVSKGSNFEKDDLWTHVFSSDSVVTLSLTGAEGKYYWRVREVISEGEWSSIDSFQINSSKSVEDIDLAHLSPKIHPNPASRFVRINSDREILACEIVDATGKSQIVASSAEIRAEQIDISGLASGPYFIVLSMRNDVSRVVPLQVR